jgi:putative acetyltransferase
VIRPERAEDAAAVADVVTAAFGRPDEARLVEALRPAAALSLVAQDERGGVVGHVMLSHVGLGPGSAVALAPLAVAPEQQRRGIGAALVRAALAEAEARGEALVLVLGDPGYYGRFGFRPATALGIESPFAGAGDAFQALPLARCDPRLCGLPRYPGPLAPAASPEGHG